MSKPIIGIPAGYIVNKGGVKVYQSPWMDVNAILAAGGLPVLLPAALPLDEIAALVAQYDGFYLTGGGDINPEVYGEESHERIYGVNPERDAFELAFVRQIILQDKPLLTVCRGTQMLNVACGGTLYVDIASHIPGAKKHDWWPYYKRNKLVHDVSVTAGSRFAKIVEALVLHTNSLHHQSINRVGDGLQSVAFASDGVIEALEHPDKRFIFGVQWHPEWLQDQQPMRAIYQEFVRACQEDNGTQG